MANDPSGKSEPEAGAETRTGSARPAAAFSAPGLAGVIAGLGALNLLCLLGTWYFIVTLRQTPGGWTGTRYQSLLIQLHLGAENVVAAWYASMLFLAVAVAAVGCYCVDRTRPSGAGGGGLRLGWLVVALLAAGLSLDEVGSIHERLGYYAHTSDLPVKPLLVLLALPAAVALGVFGWRHVARVRQAAAWIAAGLVLAMGVVVVEVFEERSAGEGLALPLAIVLGEEGLEVFATLALLTGVLVYLARQARESGLAGRDIAAQAAGGSTLLLLAVTLPGWLLAGAILRHAPEGDVGIPHNWFPAALAVLLAGQAVLLWRIAAPRPALARMGDLSLAGWALAVSLYHGAYLSHWQAVMLSGHGWPVLEAALLGWGGMTVALLAVRGRGGWSGAGLAAGMLLWGGAVWWKAPDEMASLWEVSAVALLLVSLAGRLHAVCAEAGMARPLLWPGRPAAAAAAGDGRRAGAGL